MLAPQLRSTLQHLRHTPFHPQWLIFRHSKATLTEVAQQTNGLTLDIGSGRQTIRPYLSPNVTYLPLDYYDTAVSRYQVLPDLFADAQALPLQAASFDTILLLDVLEHLPRPADCMAEIARVLKTGGTIIIQVPFLYPLHDVPYDFQRWTEYGLTQLAAQAGLTVQTMQPFGSAVETACLLLNLATSHTVLHWFERKNPLFVLVIFLPFVLLINNLIGWLASLLSLKQSFMPQGYRLYITKA